MFARMFAIFIRLPSRGRAKSHRATRAWTQHFGEPRLGLVWPGPGPPLQMLCPYGFSATSPIASSTACTTSVNAPP